MQSETGRRLDIDQVFKVLSDPVRRALLMTLSQEEYFCSFDGMPVHGICVQDLSTLLDLPQSTISRHLAILRHAGLVGHSQRGTWHYYACNEETLAGVTQCLASLQKTELKLVE